MKPLNDLDEQMKMKRVQSSISLRRPFKRNGMLRAIESLWNTARKVLDIILLMGRFLSVLTEL